jgi:hypothetical protein
MRSLCLQKLLREGAVLSMFKCYQHLIHFAGDLGGGGRGNGKSILRPQIFLSPETILRPQPEHPVTIL